MGQIGNFQWRLISLVCLTVHRSSKFGYLIGLSILIVQNYHIKTLRIKKTHTWFFLYKKILQFGRRTTF